MREHAPTIIRTENDAEFAETAALLFWQELEQTNNFIVSLPTGSTPLGMYHYLTAHYAQRQDAWERMHYVALDEYIGLPLDDERLFQNWLDRELFERVRLPQHNRTVFDSSAQDPEQEATRMENWLAENGPLDLVMLGLGTNGHIAFNEPGSDFDSVTRVVGLAPDTREANAKYWTNIDDVPAQAYTLGLQTIAKAKKIVLLVNGEHKAEILDKMLNDPITENVPATFLRTVQNVTVIADKAVLGEL